MGSATMKMIIKMPGLGVILVGVGFTIGALALTERQAHVKSIFAVIAKNRQIVLISAVCSVHS